MDKHSWISILGAIEIEKRYRPSSRPYHVVNKMFNWKTIFKHAIQGISYILWLGNILKLSLWLYEGNSESKYRFDIPTPTNQSWLISA